MKHVPWIARAFTPCYVRQIRPRVTSACHCGPVYTIGFRIAQSYLKPHLQEAPANRVNTEARTFLQKSGYTGM